MSQLELSQFQAKFLQSIAKETLSQSRVGEVLDSAAVFVHNPEPIIREVEKQIIESEKSPRTRLHAIYILDALSRRKKTGTIFEAKFQDNIILIVSIAMQNTRSNQSSIRKLVSKWKESEVFKPCISFLVSIVEADVNDQVIAEPPPQVVPPPQPKIRKLNPTPIEPPMVIPQPQTSPGIPFTSPLHQGPSPLGTTPDHSSYPSSAPSPDQDLGSLLSMLKKQKSNPQPVDSSFPPPGPSNAQQFVPPFPPSTQSSYPRPPQVGYGIPSYPTYPPPNVPPSYSSPQYMPPSSYQSQQSQPYQPPHQPLPPPLPQQYNQPPSISTDDLKSTLMDLSEAELLLILATTDPNIPKPDTPPRPLSAHRRPYDSPPYGRDDRRRIGRDDDRRYDFDRDRDDIRYGRRDWSEERDERKRKPRENNRVHQDITESEIQIMRQSEEEMEREEKRQKEAMLAKYSDIFKRYQDEIERFGPIYERGNELAIQSRTLWLGGADSKTRPEAIEQLLSQYGHVDDVQIHEHAHSGFARMGSRYIAEKINSMTTLEVDGVSLKLGWAKPSQNPKLGWNRKEGESIIHL
ncbi:hypothetical protein BLNAU_6587 [Blattamonas nauphoetae]|uniref:CID domain-containing protein n=1 Tax=Blattamonas nauphoetae TaxID=2049346 RepID=A0ABQ9Y4D0_9EUKA|nr:hypothetical protein BLNAU_6587 [Blattamonas nauphoetae]